MAYKKILDHAIEHRYALVFAGGIAAAVVGKKILESDAVKEATTNCVANVLSVKKDAESRLEEIKEDAEAQICEEDEEEKVEIEVEEVEEKPVKKTSKKSKK